MRQQKYTQAQQVIDTLRTTGGYATLGDLYHLVDTKSWATKTPNESIRRIVQQSNEIFKIQPGLWALEECREEVMRKSAKASAFFVFAKCTLCVKYCCAILNAPTVCGIISFYSSPKQIFQNKFYKIPCIVH